MPKPHVKAINSQKKRASAPTQDPETKLHFSELRYRRLFETAQDGILILDADSGKIEDVNPFLKELLGYSQSELVGKELWQIGVFNDIVGSRAAFLQLQTKGYIRYKDLPLQTKNGQTVEVEFISNVYMVDTQKVIQCNIRDITARKKAEEAIKTRKQQLERLSQQQDATKRAMLNVMEDLEAAKATIEQEKAKDEAMFASIGEGLIAVDNDRKIMTVNKAAEDMLGWTAKELIGKIITTLPLEDEDGHLMPLEKRPTYQALSSGKTTTVTYFFVKKDKTRFPIAINVTPIILEGKTIGLIETLRDVTREQEIDQAKSEFVSLASHQLRTPLGIIKWYLEALQGEDYFAHAPSGTKKYLKEIYKSNERVLNLVRDLLSVSRIEQRRIKNTPRLINPTQIVGEVARQMQILAVKKKIALQLITPRVKLPPIAIDSLRLHEVIENLIANAIEYTGTGGRVEVTVDKVGQSLVLRVKDSGIGISTADQKKLFTKFFRSEKATGHNPEGSGLGLYVVKSYVEGWKGKISVESVEGKGSSFTISLPLRQDKEQPRSKSFRKRGENG